MEFNTQLPMPLDFGDEDEHIFPLNHEVNQGDEAVVNLLETMAEYFGSPELVPHEIRTDLATLVRQGCRCPECRDR